MKEKIWSWVENNRDKIVNHISWLLLPNEKVGVWTFWITAPAEWMDWFPIIDIYYKTNKKNCYLVLTDRRLIILQVKGLSLDIVNQQEWNRKDISSIKHVSHTLSDSIEVTFTDWKKILYKDTDKDEAIGMEYSFTH